MERLKRNINIKDCRKYFENIYGIGVEKDILALFKKCPSYIKWRMMSQEEIKKLKKNDLAGISRSSNTFAEGMQKIFNKWAKVEDGTQEDSFIEFDNFDIFGCVLIDELKKKKFEEKEKNNHNLILGGAKYTGCKFYCQVKTDGGVSFVRAVVYDPKNKKDVDSFLWLRESVHSKADLKKATAYMYNGDTFENMTQDEFIHKYCVDDKTMAELNEKQKTGWGVNRDIFRFFRMWLLTYGKKDGDMFYHFLHEKHIGIYMLYGTGLTTKYINKELKEAFDE